MPRRVATYPLSSGWGLTNMIETISAYVIALSMLLGLLNIIITLRKPRNAPADPWGGNSLEWATSSPPPPHNFDALPEIHSERPVRDLRLAVSAAARSAGPPGPPGPAGPHGTGPAGAGR
jgi:heme/copper-type cytochrome/quinol oxidase subunit 1